MSPGAIAGAAAPVQPAVRRAVSLRTQILALCTAINVAAALIAGGVVILNARGATTVEMNASLDFAERYVRETANDIAGRVSADGVLAALGPDEHPLRHVRIAVIDGAGRQAGEVGGDGEAGPQEAPAWFAALVAPRGDRLAIPVELAGGGFGTIILVGEPSDEVDEVWQDFRLLAAIGVLVNVLVFAVLALALGRLLRPLSELSSGLKRLERGDLTARVARPGGAETAVLADRFNALAEALSAAEEENTRLNRRLIAAQDDEQRALARDLSEAAAADIAALKANATTILSLAGGIRAPRAEEICDRAGVVLDRVEALQALHRRLIDRMRPAALGDGPLAGLVGDLVDDLRRREPRVRITLSLGPLAHRYGDPVDTTVLASLGDCVDELAARGRPTAIALAVGEEAEPRRLVVRAAADGFAALPADAIAGIEERVRALGGLADVVSGSAEGSRIEIAIPLAKPSAS